MKHVFVALVAVIACGPSRSPPPSQFERAQALDLAPAIFVDDIQGATLNLKVRQGVTLAFQRTRLERRGTDFSWFGSRSPGELAVVSSHKGRIFGTVISRDGIYRLTDGLSGRLQIAKLDIPKVRPLHPPRPLRALRSGSSDVQTEDGPIKIIVAYTDYAAIRCAPVSAMIKNAVALTTAISANSGLATTFELAHEYPESYFNEANYQLHDILTLFHERDDFVLEKIHAERDRVEADIAILVVAKQGAFQGTSVQTNASEDTAFSVVDCEADDDNLTLAHEIGHHLGLNDDIDKPPVPYQEGYGHFHLDASDDDRSFRTVMTNPESCPGCPLIAYWSTPDVRYPDDSTGRPAGIHDERDSVSVIKKSAGRVTRFRPKSSP